MDLTVVYSKTPKGLRARASLIGGLSVPLIKILTQIDGNTNAQAILSKFAKLTEEQLALDLAKLEKDGYIRLAAAAPIDDDSWALTEHFSPIEVEELEAFNTTEFAAEPSAADVQTPAIVEAPAGPITEREFKLTASTVSDAAQVKTKNKPEAKVKVQALQSSQEVQRAAKAEAAARLKADLKARIEAEKAAAKALEVFKKPAELQAIPATKNANSETKVAAKTETKTNKKELPILDQVAPPEANESAQLEIAQNTTQNTTQDAHAKAIDEAKQKTHGLMAKAQQKQQTQADKLRALAQAEVQAQIDAKENSRLEMERIAQEAETARKADVAKEKAAIAAAQPVVMTEAELRAAAEEAQLAEQEKVVVNAIKIKNEVVGRKEIKETAAAEAQALAQLQTKDSFFSSKMLKKNKATAIVVGGLIVLVAAWIFLK